MLLHITKRQQILNEFAIEIEKLELKIVEQQQHLAEEEDQYLASITHMDTYLQKAKRFYEIIKLQISLLKNFDITNIVAAYQKQVEQLQNGYFVELYKEFLDMREQFFDTTSGQKIQLSAENKAKLLAKFKEKLVKEQKKYPPLIIPKTSEDLVSLRRKYNQLLRITIAI